MSVKIRMTRTGANRDLSYRVVATESRNPRDGQHLEILGWYDPKREGANCSLKLDRFDHWVGKGAVVSATVASLVRKARRTAASAGAAAPA
jgi:small subunit ribosomal protein S16